MTVNISYGYKWENGIVVVDKEESAIVKKIFELFIKSDMNQGKIAKQLNELNFPTKSGKDWYYYLIHKILKNGRYTGEFDYPQIISKEMFDEAIKKLNINNAKFKKRVPNHEINVSKTNVYSKIIKCSECGRFMLRRSINKTNNYWLCNNAKCNSNCISEKKLDKLVENLLLRIATSPHKVQMEKKKVNVEISFFEDYRVEENEFLRQLNEKTAKIFESIPSKDRSNDLLNYVYRYKNEEIKLEELKINLIKEIDVSIYDGIIIELLNGKTFCYEYKLKECN